MNLSPGTCPVCASEWRHAYLQPPGGLNVPQHQTSGYHAISMRHVRFIFCRHSPRDSLLSQICRRHALSSKHAVMLRQVHLPGKHRSHVGTTRRRAPALPISDRWPPIPDADAIVKHAYDVSTAGLVKRLIRHSDVIEPRRARHRARVWAHHPVSKRATWKDVRGDHPKTRTVFPCPRTLWCAR